MNRLALVVGVSCSGKDFLLSRLPKSFPRSINFGDLLFKELIDEFPTLGGRDQVQDLPAVTVTEAVFRVSQRLVGEQPLIVTSHTVVRLGEELIIRPKAHDLLDPIVYVHVSAPVREIVERRGKNCRGREELLESVEQIELHQRISELASEQLAISGGARFFRVWNQEGNGSLEEFITALEVLN